MPEVWQIPLGDFVGRFPIKEPSSAAEAAADERHLCREIEEGSEGWTRRGMRRTGTRGFYIAEVPGTSDVILINHDESCHEFDVCGGYVGPSLWIERGVRGRGLAAELVLAKADLLDGRMEPESYTEAGRAAHVSAHRLAVERAIGEGFRVPSHVLSDYPGMGRKSINRPMHVPENVAHAPGMR